MAAVAHRALERLAPALVVLLVATAACAGSGEEAAKPEPPRGEASQRILRELSLANDAGAIALVRTGAATWHGAAGREDGRLAAATDRFAIGSVTKTFVATAVLLLVADGRLSLADTVDTHLPGRLRGGRRITIRHLLNHTSGLGSEFSVDLSPVTAQPPLVSPPGSAHSYSNQNYRVLGVIVERVTRRPLEAVVRDLVFRPLRLYDTSYGTATLRPPTRRSRPWLGLASEEPDVHGGGGIVSTTDDLATFFGALLGGDLLPTPERRAMTSTVAIDEARARAGLGIFEFRLPCGVAWGHGGGEWVYSDHVLTSGDGSKTVVVAQAVPNTGWPSARDAAFEMFCR